ncbi:hypothetical protein [Halovenus amylolytica]|uniref:hypothetical protein n=1 Tax=Halovenus amylolytica TaxID=2500550 RepID=UPI003D6B71D0
MVLEKFPGIGSDRSSTEADAEARKDLLNQLAGITGLGWTTSMLGFLSTVVGYGNGIVSRLVTEPQSLLYLGGVFFLATLGLDRLVNRTTEESRD